MSIGFLLAGIADVSIMPLLAFLVDNRHVAVYGTVYAIAQVSISLGFAIGENTFFLLQSRLYTKNSSTDVFLRSNCTTFNVYSLSNSALRFPTWVCFVLFWFATRLLHWKQKNLAENAIQCLTSVGSRYRFSIGLCTSHQMLLQPAPVFPEFVFASVEWSWIAAKWQSVSSGVPAGLWSKIPIYCFRSVSGRADREEGRFSVVDERYGRS